MEVRCPLPSLISEFDIHKLARFHRSITRPFFTRERIHDFEIYERNCEIAIAHSKKRLAEGHSIDFQASAIETYKILYLSLS